MAETIVDTIADYARERVRTANAQVDISELRRRCEQIGPATAKRFETALRQPGVRLICEVKKASPSKGIISEDFPYLDIATSYDQYGADCISCLTEPRWFLGSDDIFRDIRAHVSIPMIRKDFVVDEYQLYEARLMGADAVLLICSLHNTAALRRYLALADELGLDALVEAHDEREIDSALEAGARIVGVNNRNLKDFTVDFSNAARLCSQIPQDVVYVAESGVRTPQDLAAVREIGADAALVGEMLMRAADRQTALQSMIAECGR